MPNAARNEMPIEMMGKTYMVRPTFAAISNIEGALQSGILSLGQEIVANRLPVSQLAVILHHMMGTDPEVARRDVPRIDDIGTELLDVGSKELMAQCAEFLLEAFQGTGRLRSPEKGSGEA